MRDLDARDDGWAAEEWIDKGPLAVKRQELMEDPATRCPVCLDVWLANFREGVVEQVHEASCPLADWNPVRGEGA